MLSVDGGLIAMEASRRRRTALRDDLKDDVGFKV